MVSILGDYNYTFPKPISLKLKLKDMLEDNVNEKYYLSDKMINCFMAETKMGNITRKDRFMQNINRENQDIANSITTLNGSRVTDNFIFNKHLTETLERRSEPIKDGSYIDGYNRIIRDDDLSSTISTRINASNDTYVAIKNNTKQGYLEATIGDGIDISSRMEHHRGTVQKGKSQTITTMGGGRI